MKKLLSVVLLVVLLGSAPLTSAHAATSGTFSADGTVTVTQPGYNSSGLANTLFLSGTWGSGTITIEASPDNGTTWVAISGYSWTADTIANLAFRWTKLRLKLTGATGPSLNWWVL